MSDRPGMRHAATVAGLGMPMGCLRVRTGGGPPGRSLAREKAEHGGAAAAAPTRPEEQRR